MKTSQTYMEKKGNFALFNVSFLNKLQLKYFLHNEREHFLKNAKNPIFEYGSVQNKGRLVKPIWKRKEILRSLR